MILEIPDDRVTRVAIDGVDGAGKTTFADEIAFLLLKRGKVAIRGTVDGFHHSKSIRYRMGRDSPEGFFRDSYDYASLKESLLDPLSPSGSGRYRTAVVDHVADASVSCAEEVAPPRACLIFDGIFLHRPELRDYWDFSIFLHVKFEVSIPRGAQRGPGFGSPDPEASKNRRYVEGRKLYFRECQPERHATLVIDNNSLDFPHIVCRPER